MKVQSVIPYIFVATLSACVVIAQETDDHQVRIRNTEVHLLQSDYVKDMEYHIHITLPDAYQQTDQNYPVVYYTDAFYWGATVIETYRLLRAFEYIPPLILVGISYDYDEDQALALRARDFTPTYLTDEEKIPWLRPLTPDSGGAGQFLDFFEKELIPSIENKYRADSSDRGYLGYSYGGLFGVHVLFTRPDLFQRYFLGAPTIIWDDYYVLKEEEKFRDKLAAMPLRVFMAIGSEDFADLITSWAALRDRLNNPVYDNMRFDYFMINGENHLSAIPGLYSRAFQVLYGE